MTSTPPTLDELIELRRSVAILVQRFGDRFMPVFERLDREVKNRQHHNEALSNALLEQSHRR